MRDQAGKEFDVQVVGSADGSVWGGDNGVYTDDSSLAAAAVHAGLLKNGERGVVRVRILPAQDHYAGSNRNGITSESWESWGGSFQLLGTHGGGDRKTEEQSETLKDKTVREELLDLSRSLGF